MEEKTDFKIYEWEIEKYIDLKIYLFKISDQKYKEFQSKLLGVEKRLIGVRTPELKKIAKDISKGNWRSFMNISQDEYYEESVIRGLLLGYIKVDYEERIQYIEKFIKKIDNWATCDITVANLKFLKKEKDLYFNFVKKCIDSGGNWEIRFGIVILLDFYIESVYIDEIFLLCSSIKNRDYYVKMAQAWLLSILFIKFREKTLSYLEKNNLDPWIQNKAIQKIRESNRVKKIDKELILKYKR